MILRNQPLTSALTRAQRGEAAGFNVTEYLLVGMVNLLRGIQWQLGGDNSAPKPELYYPPGSENPDAPKKLSDAMSIEEMNERLRKYYTPEG